MATKEKWINLFEKAVGVRLMFWKLKKVKKQTLI